MFSLAEGTGLLKRTCRGGLQSRNKKGRNHPAFTCISALLCAWAQRREQNYVADGVAVGKQHDHAVNTNA